MKTAPISLLALCAAAAPVPAQTHLTVYGVADATIENVRVSNTFRGAAVPSKQRVTSNSTLLGFRGSEDLGDGLNALVQFESALSLDGAGTLFGNARDSFVGLKGRFGLIKLGNHSSPTRKIGTRMDITPGSTGIANNEAILSRVGGRRGNAGFGDRMANAVMYDSPSFAGFTVSAIYGANENKRVGTPDQNDGKYGLGLQYASGPIYAAYAYERRNDLVVTPVALFTPSLAGNDGTNGSDNRAKNHRVGLEYDAGAFKIGLAWDRTEIDDTRATVGEVRRNVFGLNGAYNLGSGELFAQFHRADDLSGSFCAITGNVCAETGARNFALGYNHKLSKRTMIKLHYAQTQNDDNAGYDIGNANVSTGNAAGFKARGIALGVRHLF